MGSGSAFDYRHMPSRRKVVLSGSSRLEAPLRPEELKEASELKREVRQLRSQLIQYMVAQPSNASVAANQTDNETDPLQAMLSRLDQHLNEENDFMGLGDVSDSPQLMYIFYTCIGLP